MSSVKQQIEVCSECDANAKWYCVQDEANFCDEHNTLAHSLKSQKSHRILSIDEKVNYIRNEAAKPVNCKNHHMPLSLYCLSCKSVCCVACVTVDIHKQHSDQVKSVVDVANDERKILTEHVDKIQKLSDRFIEEQNQLEKKLQSLSKSQVTNSQDIDKHFDAIIECVQERRKTLKKHLQEKYEIHRENICLRQEEVKNMSLCMKECLEDGQYTLSLHDFAALSECKKIIEKISKLETETKAYYLQVQLIDFIPFYMSNEALLKMINTLGTIGSPPTPAFIEENCEIHRFVGNIEWKSIEHTQLITNYILELGKNRNTFNEVYRGSETKYDLQGLKSNTAYILRLCAFNEFGKSSSVQLKIRTANKASNNWLLSMSSTYSKLNAENTHESLLDGSFTTGAATNTGNSWIQATFPSPVTVASITIAPLHKNAAVWSPTNGNGGYLQFSNDNQTWIIIGTINYVNEQQQTITVNNITAQYWRLSYNSHLGTSSFIFK